jgi:hypothetical protein
MKSDKKPGAVRSFGFRAPRVSTNFSFVLEVISTGERYEALCTDISEDGLAAQVPEPLSPKTQVTMRMLLPGGTVPLQILGSVEYSQDKRCGLTFLFASPDERKEVQTFIQSMS